MKGFAKPPALVETVLQGVCILFGEKPEWKEAKGLMNKGDFLGELIKFDKDAIKAPTIKKLKPYIDNPEFTPEKVKSVSSAACSLCMWVKAMYTYYHVARTVEPKKEALAKAQSEVAQMQALLSEKQTALAQVRRSLTHCQSWWPILGRATLQCLAFVRQRCRTASDAHNAHVPCNPFSA